MDDVAGIVVASATAVAAGVGLALRVRTDIQRKPHAVHCGIGFRYIGTPPWPDAQDVAQAISDATISLFGEQKATSLLNGVWVWAYAADHTLRSPTIPTGYVNGRKAKGTVAGLWTFVPPAHHPTALVLTPETPTPHPCRYSATIHEVCQHIIPWRLGLGMNDAHTDARARQLEHDAIRRLVIR